MHCYSVAKHIATVSIDTDCITIHLSNHLIYEKTAMAFIDAVDIYACALHYDKEACYKYTAGFAFCLNALLQYL